ncbi:MULTISPECIES: helix-turn-helix transcriptional regulator [unclassified Cryobacterium]|uniref:helix-turn-helix transcriptional regulator n=1 Tax=unclassified Cryobacterium TaxID=2649013 RepID=UPI002AB5B6B1|nr:MULTISPECIES: LuxR C-terminal-related transcriptional regulator [unclassified Cryobacterium]MDY7542921.1 LuxR C-terminal-related transcriptional regulator [Cryobacterium sp. 5B3]MEA9999235.1 LuxR C-terminal-related transcriptional regulator [Cryobacterium sp. RTS3]MEB0265380.1 LuxR C-terminal-related transcriptional regulator [Cryobacterium sp. 10I5]MEB0274900.1 LuxR C-terminal-related transcriptional regulator [Cryobacterium sp. 5B3]
MSEVSISPSVELLLELRKVLAHPLLGIAGAFSDLLQSRISHGALVIFTEDCTGRPQKKAGQAEVIDHVTIAELDILRDAVALRGGSIWNEPALLARSERAMSAWIASTGALLVLTDPELTAAAPTGVRETRDLVAALWELVASGIRSQVVVATPDYLRDSRMASRDRATLIAELTDAHSTTLELLLAVLRSRQTGDAAARQTAIDLTVAAMVQLRAVSDRDRILSEEPVATAFERLRNDLRPLARFGDLDVQFIEPPVNGRALPGEVAHAGRAIVRGAVLALVDQPGVARVRVQWDCDGHNLLINIRDDGPGDLSVETPSVRHLVARVTALDGDFHVDATPGWGSDISVSLPLDPPSSAIAPIAGWGLTARERAVLDLVATGARNRAIADALSISENTVKFHVANVLRKMGAVNRAELASLVSQNTVVTPAT